MLDVDKVLGFPANPAGTLNESPVAEIEGSQAGLNGNFAIALDASGNIYVTNAQNNSVTVFAANPTGTDLATPIATIVGSNTGLNYPDGIALDASGKIYVANGSGSGPSITVYAASPSGTLNETPLATIAGNSTTLEQPTGLALDAAGRIYTADPVGNNGITIFAANPVGTMNEAPLATISGNGTGLDYPLGVALDASGKIYVPSELNNTIAVFAANASGNAAPIATISGSSTGLNNPAGLGLDSSGKIYVSNQAGANASVTVYAANPSGTLNEAPLATISGSNTQLSAPAGIAIR